jgi:selenophosphate synthase
MQCCCGGIFNRGSVVCDENIVVVYDMAGDGMVAVAVLSWNSAWLHYRMPRVVAIMLMVGIMGKSQIGGNHHLQR